MEQFILNLPANHIDKLQNLLHVFGTDELLIDKFYEYHINRLKREITRMQVALAKYETKYNLSSEEFYSKMEDGQLDDSRDFVMWAGIYALLLDHKKQLAQLV